MGNHVVCGVSIGGGIPKRLVYTRQSDIEMDDCDDCTPILRNLHVDVANVDINNIVYRIMACRMKSFCQIWVMFFF